MTTKNLSGISRLTYYRADEDACDYVTDSPCPALKEANQIVSLSLQKATEVSESKLPKEIIIQSWAMHQLIREMAGKVGKTTNNQIRMLTLAQMRKVMEEL